MSLYTQPRHETWTWRLLTQADAAVGLLPGVTDGHLDVNGNKEIRGTGSLTWKGRASDQPDWPKVRIQPVYTARTRAGLVTQAMGVYLPAVPSVSYGRTGVEVNVELYDKSILIVNDGVEGTYSVPAGTVATTLIRTLLGQSAPGSLLSVVDSTETLRTAMTWEAGTSPLRIINDVCKAINYFSVWVDGRGAFRVEPYRPVGYRAVEWEFVHGKEGIFLPEFERTQDRFTVPNKVVLIGQSDGETAALVGVAVNNNPADPNGYPQRQRWETITETGDDATSQAIIDARAARRLLELSSPSATLNLDHYLLPLDPNDVVRFRHPDLPTTLAALQSYSIDCRAGALASSVYQEVTA